MIAGGGTGGHVLAGVAIADEWRRLHGAHAEVLFIGSSSGIENRLVPQAGYDLRTLWVGSLNRVSLGKKLKTFFQLPWAFFYSFILLVLFRPQAVVGVGGYSSGPVVLLSGILSKVLGIRVAILEQNSVPGMTNRILGRFCRFVFSAFRLEASFFPKAQIELTGNPVRSNLLQELPPSSRDPFVIFVFGGSQGALGLNTLVLQSLPYLREEESLQILHQTGEKDFERVRDAYLSAGLNARVVKFVDDMASAYREASLLICRAGSGTLSEISAVKRASILVPLPSASDDHQRINAEQFAETGGAWVAHQDQTTGQDLAQKILELVRHPKQIDGMEESAGRFFKPNAAKRIVERLSEKDT